MVHRLRFLVRLRVQKVYLRLCVHLGVGAKSWRSVKQSSIIDSTIEAEYIAASQAIKVTVWPKNYQMDLEVVSSAQSAITLYCDNSGAVANSKEP